MASRKNLLSVDYHHDTDTGMYKVGEIDFGVSGELDDYLVKYGQEGMDNVLGALTHLIWHVQQFGYPIIKKNQQSQNGVCISKD